MKLKSLFLAVADILDGDLDIERFGAEQFILASDVAFYDGETSQLKQSILNEMAKPDAHTSCAIIAETPLMWQPPTTSTDPAYISDSVKKVHVELIGPDGIVKSNKIRAGLYGMYPGANYGIRTHPAEEIFIMCAGEVYWRRGDGDYDLHKPGEKSYHQSMLPHATKTTDKSFMSVFIWAGDVSTAGYKYSG